MTDRVSRKEEERPKVWQPPKRAVEPLQMDGVTFRWIREYTNPEHNDLRNVESKRQEGYEPVRADEDCVKHLTNVTKGDDGLIRRGGLILMKIDSDLAAQRNKHYSDQAKLQQKAVEETALGGLKRQGTLAEAKVTKEKSFPKVPTTAAKE